MSVVGCTCSSVYWSVEMKNKKKKSAFIAVPVFSHLCLRHQHTTHWKMENKKKQKIKKMYNGCIEIICNCINGATVIKLNN